MINSLLLLIIFAAAALIYLSYRSNSEEGIVYAACAIALSIIVGVSFSVFDRIGMIVPAQRALEEMVKEGEIREERLVKESREREATLARHVAERDARLERENAERQAQTERDNGERDRRLADAVDRLAGFSKYQTARFNFGFNAVAGEVDDTDPRQLTIKRGGDEFAIQQIESRTEGSSIDYLNTFLENDSVYVNALRRAVLQGTAVRVLLLNPDPAAPAFISRYHSCLSRLYRGSIQTVADRVRALLMQIDALPKELSEAPGSFEVRYYSNSLNFPMILITDETDTSAEVAYTGFYTGVSSEAMPYIEWRGGGFQIIKHFSDVFNSKWNDPDNLTCLYPENALSPRVHPDAPENS